MLLSRQEILQFCSKNLIVYIYSVYIVFWLRSDEIRTEILTCYKTWCICVGMWFMHCHIDAHLSIGLAMVFEVEDGPNTKLPAPPPDLPQCWGCSGVRVPCTFQRNQLATGPRIQTQPTKVQMFRTRRMQAVHYDDLSMRLFLFGWWKYILHPLPCSLRLQHLFSINYMQSLVDLKYLIWERFQLQAARPLHLKLLRVLWS